VHEHVHTHTHTHTHTNLYAKFCLYIETTYIYVFQMRRKCTKGGWCVLAVVTMQCADVFWLSSLCNILVCFCCHHDAAYWCVSAVITVQHPYVLSHLYHKQNISWVGWRKLLLVLYTHPATGNMILCKLYTSTRLHIAHPWMLQSPHHTLVFNQVTRYPESWFVSWESLLRGFSEPLEADAEIVL
jgi:hypothetical protein